jgi:hypothetical protein
MEDTVGILHILRDEPDERTRELIAAMSAGQRSRTFALFGGAVDYDELVQWIFEADRVICWW